MSSAYEVGDAPFASGSSKDLDRKQKLEAKAKQIVSSLGTNSAKCRASVKPPANQSAWLWLKAIGLAGFSAGDGAVEPCACISLQASHDDEGALDQRRFLPLTPVA